MGEEHLRWYNPDMPSRSRVYRTEAVILRRINLGEADRILTAYSPDHGKLRLIAKGVRKPTSRKAGHLEPFTRVQLLVARGRNMDIITQAEAIDMYPALRADLARIGRAAYVAELIDRFVVEGEESRQLYRLVLATYERLETEVEPAMALRFFQIHMLLASGFGPELYSCLKCGRDLSPVDQYFSHADGGVYCPECGRVHEGNLKPVTVNGLKMLRFYQRSQYAQVRDVVIREPVQREIDALLEGYLQYILERSLNAARFLRRVAGEQ